ncbi:MAG: ATP-dependent DNA helicase RecG [bacterium]|nr:ATP-dependent DNA helicase RecG [bacterium]
MNTNPLSTPLENLFHLRTEHKKALARLKLHTAGDLLRYLPHRYTNPHELHTVLSAPMGTGVSIAGRITKIESGKTWQSKKPKASATLEDVRGDRLSIIWFSQPYMAKYLAVGDVVIATGTLQEHSGGRSMINPSVEQSGSNELTSSDSLFDTGSAILLPTYPETRGISSRWLHEHVKRLLAQGFHQHAEDPIPTHVRESLNLPDLKTALIWAHTPKKISHAQSARKRFAFSEIFVVQTHRERIRSEFAQLPSYRIQHATTHTKAFLDTLPFKPTKAQCTATSTIAKELEQGHPMCRLLEGDVGSGKTAVAAAASYAVLIDKEATQVAIMAPTEILARQHLETFIELFKETPIRIGFLAGSECRVFPSKIDPEQGTRISKKQLKTWIEEGHIRLLIGTHALIQKSVQFKNLALVVIDEQHRFGITQRHKLAIKGQKVPHLLSMTATPIPRTLALTMFGDLDLSVLDELPAGRKQTKTKVISPQERGTIWPLVTDRLTAKEQVFVVCPRISEADPADERALAVRSTQHIVTEFKKELPNWRIEVLHSKLKPKEKEEIMHRFTQHEIDILVSTTVVEVGVNIPNATMMIIEGAERFGLAQLHQLRGRVGRSSKQATCLLIPSNAKENSLTRLKLLASTTSGFKLAEYDLMNRGAGGLGGGKQWGVSDIAMEALKNMKLVELAKSLARTLVEEDISLTAYPALNMAVEQITEKLHLE